MIMILYTWDILITGGTMPMAVCTFLEKYDQFLAPDGNIEFKTDNQDLFSFSLDEIENSDIWHLDAYTRDLHNDPVLNAGNIMTEYEQKFSSHGNPICKLIASR